MISHEGAAWFIDYLILFKIKIVILDFSNFKTIINLNNRNSLFYFVYFLSVGRSPTSVAGTFFYFLYGV